VSETDARGQFVADVPAQSPVLIRALSRLRSTDLQVVDAPATRFLYSVSTPFDARETSTAQIVDRSRVSGAFNILEVVQRSNDLIRLVDSRILPPASTIFWSTSNTYSTIKTSHFSLSSNTAFILGDRNLDSDEF